jgi:hypothetical protein
VATAPRTVTVVAARLIGPQEPGLPGGIAPWGNALPVGVLPVGDRAGIVRSVASVRPTVTVLSVASVRPTVTVLSGVSDRRRVIVRSVGSGRRTVTVPSAVTARRTVTVRSGAAGPVVTTVVVLRLVPARPGGVTDGTVGSLVRPPKIATRSASSPCVPPKRSRTCPTTSSPAISTRWRAAS